jgi:hypothetical protein
MPDASERAARLLSISNYNTVKNAFSSVTIVEELRWTRNCVVHELPETCKKLRGFLYGRFAAPLPCPPDYVLQKIPGTANLIIDTWMDELGLALRAAVQ